MFAQIDFVCHDAQPYPDASGVAGDCYAPVKAMGKFWETQRTDVSASPLPNPFCDAALFQEPPRS